jgi:hypothetical protein
MQKIFSIFIANINQSFAHSCRSVSGDFDTMILNCGILLVLVLDFTRNVEHEEEGSPAIGEAANAKTRREETVLPVAGPN